MEKFRNLIAAFEAKKLIIAVLVCFVLPGTYTHAQPNSRQLLKPTDSGKLTNSLNGCQGFAGKWDGGSYGIMTLRQNGNSVSGTYEWKGTQSIRGTVRGNVLRGRFSQPTYPEDRYKSGSIKFTLAADGNSWSGTWTDKDGNHAGTWSGTCISN